MRGRLRNRFCADALALNRWRNSSGPRQAGNLQAGVRGLKRPEKGENSTGWPRYREHRLKGRRGLRIRPYTPLEHLSVGPMKYRPVIPTVYRDRTKNRGLTQDLSRD